MADLTITVSSKTRYYREATGTKSGTSTASGRSSAANAESDAKFLATSAATNNLGQLSTPTPASGGSSDTSTIRVGTEYSTSSGAGTPSAASYSIDDTGVTTWSSSCSWSATKWARINQVRLDFTIPSNVTAAMVSKAELKFTCTQNNSTSVTYYVHAPASSSSSQTNYQKYSSDTLIDKTAANTDTFASGTTTTSHSMTVDITKVFKRCITTGSWILIAYPGDSYAGSRYITITGTPTIEITYAYTKNNAPTSITSNVAIQKRSGEVTITVSGATAGTNNTISGYTIYWKAGSAPTTSSYDGSTSDSPYKFTIPSGATRGSTYYIKAVANSSVGSSWDSNISSAQATVKVNTLPNAPSAVNANPARIKTTGNTTVKFSVTAGTDSDNQTRTLYYATSANGTKTLFTSPLSKSLNANARTYYFWTYDGLEYSENYTYIQVPINTRPSITSGTFSVSGSKVSTSGWSVSGSGNSYKWYTSYSEDSGTTWKDWADTGQTNLNFSNYDITYKVQGWNSIYKFKLVVTDDIGEEWPVEYSTQEGFTTPAIPSGIVTVYNQTGKNENVSNTNTGHFGNGIRVVLNGTNINSEITYNITIGTTDVLSSYRSFNDGANNINDIDLSNIKYGEAVNCKIHYKYAGNLYGYSPNISLNRTSDITPVITNVAQSGNNIYAAEQPTLTITMNQGTLQAFDAINDMPQDSPEDNYTLILQSVGSITLNGGSSTYSVNGISVSEGTVTWIVKLNSVNWSTLFGTGDLLPIGNYTLKAIVKMTNSFGIEFTGQKEGVQLSFAEKAITGSSCELAIKTGENTYTTIPSNYTSSNRYPLFENQTLQFRIGGFSCYTNNPVRIVINDGQGHTNTTNINPVLNNNEYKITNQSITFGPLAAIGLNIDDLKFTVTITSGVNSRNQGTATTSFDNKQCKYVRTNMTAVNFTIRNITREKDPNTNEYTKSYTITYDVTDLGGSGSVPCIDNYSSKQVELYYSLTANGTYNVFGNTPTANLGNSTTDSIEITWTTSPEVDPPTNFYVGFKIYVTNNFQAITIDGTTYTPTGEATHHTTQKTNVFIFYGEMPVILYGKNFLGINTDTPKTGSDSNSEGILTIRPYENHKVIYAGYTNYEGSITFVTQKGLVLDNFYIDGGTWNNS